MSFHTSWATLKVLYGPDTPPALLWEPEISPVSHMNSKLGYTGHLDPMYLVSSLSPFFPGYVADNRADLPEVARLGVTHLVWVHPRIAFKTHR